MSVATVAASSPDDPFREQLEQLFRCHRRDLCNLAFASVRSRDDADDIVQTVFLRLLSGELRAPPLSIAYVSRAVVNAARDHLRRKTAHRSALMRWSAGFTVHASRSTEARLLKNRVAGILTRAVAEIPPRQRLVFYMLHVSGMSPSDVAAELGIEARSVIQLAYRARLRVREILVSWGFESGDDLEVASAWWTSSK